jgi:ubiquinone/menaquinone biosynthesis C-methylase UbiE
MGMIRKPKIFVAMPFKDELENVFYAIQQICDRNKYDVIRADLGRSSRPIFNEIIQSIVSSDVIIADVTQNNPNVFLELGYSWAIGKEVLLIANQLDSLPFDIRGHRIIPYGDPSNARRVEESLLEYIESAIQMSQRSAHLTQPILDIARSVSDLESKEHLYYKLVETHLNRVKDQVEKWLNGSMEVDKYELIEKGLEIFDKLQIGGFATYLVPIEGYWSRNDNYAEKSRTVASDPKRNLNIERVYILHSFTSLLSEYLISSIKGDEESHIKTYVVFEEDISKSAMKDFGIWDDSVVCVIEVQETYKHEFEVVGGTYSKDGVVLRQYQAFRKEIMDHAIKGRDLTQEVEALSSTTRLLLESAFRMEDLAKAHCEGSYISEANCDWYHSSWQYLRLVDMVSTPSWHHDFYQKALREALSDKKHARILISGTADYGMLQQIQSFEDNSSISEILVLDLCRTPLEICSWFRKKYLSSTIKLNYIQQDIVENVFAAKSQDLIITDAFLTRFTPDSRKKIIQEWERMLKAGGYIKTTIRLGGNFADKDQAVRSTEGDIRRYCQKVKNKTDKAGRLFKNIEAKIINKAEEYARNIISYPFVDENEIRELFDGFELKIELGTVHGEIQENTIYAKVIAKKESNSSQP